MGEGNFHDRKCCMVISLTRNGVSATGKWVKGGISTMGKIGKMLLKNIVPEMGKYGKCC